MYKQENHEIFYLKTFMVYDMYNKCTLPTVCMCINIVLLMLWMYVFGR